MKSADFDIFANEYESIHKDNIKFSGESPSYFADYKVYDLAKEFRAYNRKDIKSPKILDFGSGIGTSVPYFNKYFIDPTITCLDVSKKSLDIGIKRYPCNVDFQYFNGGALPFPDARFDIAFAACVFHHIDQKEHIYYLKEFYRILKPNGIAIVYEHNPLNPLTIKAVDTCPFDKDAKLINALSMRKLMNNAGFNRTYVKYRIFFPNILYLLRPLERFLTWLPFGAQYYSIAFK